MSSADLRQYALIEALRQASDPNLVAAFEDLMTHLQGFMPSWKIIENNGINAILKAHGLAFDDVAYLNVWNGRNERFQSVGRCFGRKLASHCRAAFCPSTG